MNNFIFPTTFPHFDNLVDIEIYFDNFVDITEI